eukprot:TRINITY_DN2656_c0_g1_i1.p4 TRINITY_DN2656_c0_g1~~TRINITY_DN2656_c0_g1_i1.p4  ORF type:complete len:161 (+),score=43.64 TRINITY_DN2656_c0_g1_i1:86-568(+)
MPRSLSSSRRQPAPAAPRETRLARTKHASRAVHSVELLRRHRSLSRGLKRLTKSAEGAKSPLCMALELSPLPAQHLPEPPKSPGRLKSLRLPASQRGKDPATHAPPELPQTPASVPVRPRTDAEIASENAAKEVMRVICLPPPESIVPKYFKKKRFALCV